MAFQKRRAAFEKALDGRHHKGVSAVVENVLAHRGGDRISSPFPLLLPRAVGFQPLALTVASQGKIPEFAKMVSFRQKVLAAPEADSRVFLFSQISTLKFSHANH